MHLSIIRANGSIDNRGLHGCLMNKGKLHPGAKGLNDRKPFVDFCEVFIDPFRDGRQTDWSLKEFLASKSDR